MTRSIPAILRYFFRRQRIEDDMHREFQFYLERETEENIRRGMGSEAARRAARVSLGGVEPIKELCRDARAGRPVEQMLQDIAYGLRVLRKNPGFTLIAILTLALGIGANTAIFSLVYGVLLRPLPYQSGERLVVLHQQAVKANVANFPFSVAEMNDYRQQNSTLDQLVEHHSMVFILLGKNFAERVTTAVVSANFFDVLGVKPVLGRTFVADDEKQGGPAVLVLSHKYWQTRHGGDPGIVGRVFQMNNRPHTVIGVLPPIPQYPAENDVYMPTSQCPFRSSPGFIQNRQARMMTVFARLKPGVKLGQAQADLSTIASRVGSSHPEAYPAGAGYGLGVAPLQDDLTHRARSTFLVLLGGAGLVLLIACANVANLMLARLLKIERELAVRRALGASRGRLVRQLLSESLLVSLAGGFLGLLLAPATLRLLVQFASRFTSRAAEIRVDSPVMFFALGVSILTGLLFGIVPAFHFSGNVNDALKQGGRSGSSNRQNGLRAGLVVAQVAVSFLLLICAGLMIRSFVRLQEVNPGFLPHNLLSVRISKGFSRYITPEEQVVLEDKINLAVRSVGGVESSAMTSATPLSSSAIQGGPGTVTFEIEGQPLSKGQMAPIVDTTTVGVDYFRTIRQPVISGRDFAEQDVHKAPLVAVVNQTMARHRWTTDPVGKRVTFDHGETWIKIVGVVGDVKEYGLEHPVGDEIYLPSKQSGFAGFLVARTAIDPLKIAPLVRAAIYQLDPLLPVDGIDSVENMEYESMASPRVTTILLGLFAALALLISACGIAAMMALAVTQRTHELGIRMALGAPRTRILNMVLREGLVLAAVGTAIGVFSAIAATRLLASMLYSTSPTDVATFLGVALLFLAVAAAACLVPARQVTAIDPLVALRQE